MGWDLRRRWDQSPPWLQDIGLAVVVGAVWFSAFDYWRAGGWSPVHPETYQVAGVWTVVCLTLRQSVPQILLVAVAVIYPLHYGEVLQTEFHLIPLMLAAFAAAHAGAFSTLVTVGLATVSTLWLSSWWMQPRPPFFELADPSQWMFGQFSVVALIGLGVLMRRQRLTTEELAARNAELERLRAVEADQAVQRERTRIARDLHDIIAHYLTAIIVRSQAAERVAGSRPEVAGETLPWITVTARDALSAIRQTVSSLRDAETGAQLAPGPSIADVSTMVERVRASGLDLETRFEPDLPELDPTAEVALVRIVQEALTNAMRHASADVIRLSMSRSGAGIVVSVEDDGTSGRAPGEEAAGGHGLLGMRERALACGGTLRVVRSNLGGWKVEVWLPAEASSIEEPCRSG